MAPRTPNLPWTDGMRVILLSLVIMHAAHLATNSNTKARWAAVNEGFYDQPEHFRLRATYYKTDQPSIRKLRDQVDKTVKEISEDVMTGNQSGKQGERSRLYELVQQCARTRKERLMGADCSGLI
jgi:hypothetical protein